MGSNKKEIEMQNCFWTFIEERYCFIVPKYLKLALSAKSRANCFGFRKLQEQEMRTEILQYIRNEVPTKVEGQDFVEIFGNNDPKSFSLDNGVVDTIIGAAEWLAEEMDSDSKFFSNKLKRPAELTIDSSQFSGSDCKMRIMSEQSADSLQRTVASTSMSTVKRMSRTLDVPESYTLLEVKRIQYNGSTLLQLLIEQNKCKIGKSDRGVKYSEALKEVAKFMYISGGKSLYDFIEANLPMPSGSSVRSYIHNSDSITEGQLRIKELKTFLQDQQLTKKVWISEDSTGIISRIRYESKSNQVIGFVLPFDDTGLPKYKSFTATSAKAIEDFFKNEKKARLLHVIIIQPLVKNAPFFCLLMYGTDDKYDYNIVLKRWRHIQNCLKSEGIEVVGQSTDGDSRAFKGMRLESGLIYGHNNSSCDIPEFKATLRSKIIYMQDTVHIGSKLRARLSKKSIILALGNYTANVAHLKILLKKCPKDEHCLTMKDLYCIDKMNFHSVLTISHPRVIKCLEKYIPHSEGTQKYLELIQKVLYSILQVDLPVERRLYCLWYSVFFLRLWRAWLLQNEQYSTEHNFITLNAYICIELNAHGIFNIILKHISENSFQDFFPYMFGSQPCESFFRLLRSFTPTYSTMVNCDLLDCMYRVKKIEQLCQSVNKKFEEDTINFPRQSQFRSSFDQLDTKKFASDLVGIPDNIPVMETNFNSQDDKCRAEIIMKEILALAKSNAYMDICKLGMDVDIIEANYIQVKCKNESGKFGFPEDFQDICTEEDIDDVNDDIVKEHELPNERENFDENICEYNEERGQSTAENNFNEFRFEQENELENEKVNCNCNHDDASANEYDDKNDSLYLGGLKSDYDLPHVPSKFVKNNKICPNCPFTFVKNKSGDRVLVWKSSIVWLLSKGVSRISSDRLARVQVSKVNKNNYELEEDNHIEKITVCNKIFNGDWCLFRSQEDSTQVEVVYVLQFAKTFGEYLSKKTWRSIEYGKDYIDVPDEQSEEKSTEGVLGQWYAINYHNKRLNFLPVTTHGYTEVTNYIAHIPEPIQEKDDLQKTVLILQDDMCEQIKNNF